MEQMSLFPLLTNEEDAEDLKGQVARFEEYERQNVIGKMLFKDRVIVIVKMA